MGSFTFKWEHPADEVYVTGTFDNWTKSVQLEKKGDIFEKTVDFEIPSDKIYYKFVVDNNWTTNESSPKEADKEGNINNFISAEVLAASAISAATINTVAPESTSAAMAGQQPLEKDKSVGINPLPASETGVNPISLQPGEKIPQHLVAGDVNKHVKLDKESYEKSDSLVGIPNPADIPPPGATTIPESGLPMAQNATINTVAPGATTAALAGQVPLEPKAVEATSGAEDKKKKKNKKKNEKKKQKKAAAANGSANDNNDESNSDEADHSAATNAAAVGGGAAAVAAAIAAGSAAVASQVSEQAVPTVDAAKAAAAQAINNNLPDAVKEKLPEQVKEALSQQETAKEVPPEVKESIKEAGQSPEAAASTTAVEEKKAVESELLQEVKPAPVAAPEEAAKPVETKPAETKPVETKPVETKPVETKPVETKPVETKPAETATPPAPALAAALSEPVENGAAKTVEQKPIETKIVVSEPVTLSPAPQATESKPADSAPEPVEATPTVPEPVKATTAIPKPLEAEPAEPAEPTPVEASPAAKSTEPASTTQPSSTTEPAANGSGSKPAAAATDKTSEVSAVDKKKKKNRLSTFFSSIKHKLSDKN